MFHSCALFFKAKHLWQHRLSICSVLLQCLAQCVCCSVPPGLLCLPSPEWAYVWSGQHPLRNKHSHAFVCRVFCVFPISSLWPSESTFKIAVNIVFRTNIKVRLKWFYADLICCTSISLLMAASPGVHLFFSWVLHANFGLLHFYIVEVLSFIT